LSLKCTFTCGLSSQVASHFLCVSSNLLMPTVCASDDQCLQCRNYTVSQKTAPCYFFNNFVKSFFIRLIIGTHIP